MNGKAYRMGSKNTFTLSAGIVEALPQPLVLLDSDLRIITANTAFCKMTQTSLAQIAGQRLYEVGRWGWNTPKLKEALENFLTADSASFDLAIEAEGDGAQSWSFHLSRIVWEPDRSAMILLVAGDLNPGQDKTEALQMFRFSVDNAPDPVFWLDKDGRYIYANEAACRSLGYTREELLQLSLFDIDPLYSKERWNQEDTIFSKDQPGDLVNIESWHLRKDGTLFPVEVSRRRLHFSDMEIRIVFARDISARKQFEQELKLTQSAIDRASIACFWVTSDDRLAYANDQASRLLGYSREELLTMSVMDFDPGLNIDRWVNFWQQLIEKEVQTLETIHQRKDGSRYPVEVTANYLKFGSEEYGCIYTRDLSEREQAEAQREKLESQLRQAQKMESIGRLAGGVAHDFNNMLSVILGYTELIKGRLSESDPLLEEMRAIEKAADQAKQTTWQLLAFSRKQVITPRPVDLNDLITGTTETLSRLIGEDIVFSFKPQKNLWKTNVDPSQIDQILVNLAGNARDAMYEGGELSIATKNVNLDEAFCREHVGSLPGDYVLLQISDTGIGMDPQTLPHVFEPFFTTKEMNKGAGLGLATVYGIVKQNDGYISVDSRKGEGTTFKIYFPKFVFEADDGAGAEQPGAKTILMVEDNKMVRDMTGMMLESLGYRVLTAADGPSALALIEAPDTPPFELLMTDVVMPEMSGAVLSEKVKAIRPDVKVLFMSGYTSSIIGQHGLLEEKVNFMQKPFSRDDLDRKLREVLEDEPEDSRSCVAKDSQ